MLYYLARLVNEEQLFTTVFLSFFGEYHGKSLCDARFSRISQYIKKASETTWIRSLEDVVNGFSFNN